MKTILLNNGTSFLIDDEDYELVSSHKWYLHVAGYVYRIKKCEDGKRRNLYLHRLLLNLVRGDGRLVDHINGNKLDNRRCNIRACTKAENGWNRGKTKNNTSGYKGVFRDTRSGKWLASVFVNGRRNSLGLFTTPEEAHLAYRSAVEELHGEFARCV